MSDKKKAFWFIALLSTLVIIPFLGETIFYSKGEPREAIVGTHIHSATDEDILRVRCRERWKKYYDIQICRN